MCKLFIITGALHRVGITRVLAAANKEFAQTERDGFGFIATANGAYARGRYFEPNRFHGFGRGLPHLVTGDIAEENHLPKFSQTLIVHGRTATSTKKLANCHPFMFGDEALAHNGVVDWIGNPEEEPSEECDSEQFFSWLRNNCWDVTHCDWAGWGAIAHVNTKTGILTIARDRAMLYGAKRRDSLGWVFATSQHHLKEICKYAGIRLTRDPLLLPDHKILSFSQRGEVTSVEDWKGFGERQLTYLDAQSWGNSSINESPESTSQKRKTHNRGKGGRKGNRSHPSLWERCDS